MTTENHATCLRPAVAGDAEKLGTVGPAAYGEAYGDFWADDSRYAAHLATFGSAVVGDFLLRHEARMWVVESEGRITGFLSLVLGSADPIDGRTSGAEFARLYLLGPSRGKGMAARLLALADAWARGNGADHLWLDALVAAPWAWRTYRRWGFEVVGETMFAAALRPELKPMLVMRRSCA